MSSNKYLFVNKSVESGSLSHSEKAERVKIHSHVQLGQIYGRKNLLGNKAKNESTPVVKAAAPKHGPQVLRWKLGSAGARRRGSSTLPVQTAEGQMTSHENRRRTSTPDSLSSSPKIPPSPQHGALALDPFDVSRIQMNAEVQRLLQYFLREAHPNTWHLQSRLSKQHKSAVQQSAEVILKSCFDSDANLFTMLASMASRLKYLEGYDYQPDSVQYVSKAIAALQGHIASADSIDERLIFNMFQLGTAEFYRWNVDASVVHLKGIKTLVDRMGGLRALKPSLVEMLVIGDGYVASETMQKPIFSASDFDIEDEDLNRHFGMGKLEYLLSGTSDIASGLLSRSLNEVVPSHLRWIVLDMAVCLMVLQDVTDNNVEGNDLVKALHWLHVRNLAIRHRLLVLETHDLRTHSIRCALVMWNFLCFTKAGRQRTAGVMAQKLQAILLEQEPQSWKEHQQVLRWILMIGAMSSDPNDSWHHWFVEQLVKALRTNNSSYSLQDVDATSLVNLSKHFLHYHPIQAPMLAKLLEEAELANC